MQTAQIYTRQFSSLQPDEPLGCDFVEALSNTFRNFLFAIWIHSSQNLCWLLVRTLLLITMSHHDLGDICHLCERLNNLYNVQPGEPWCVGAWEQAPKICLKPSSAQHCIPIPKLKLSSNLFATLASHNKTTLHTAETWLKVTIIFF